MAYSLTIAGYTFQNPPEDYRKLARLSNSPQPAFKKEATDFYQSDSQDIQFQVEGSLALDPPLGETSDDLAELERLQDIAISGGEVQVDFDPFFSGKGVIEDDPFRQQEGESTYQFTISVNSESTDTTAYPAHSTVDTGNTFEFGNLDLGYDPGQVQQNYERQTEKVKRLQGIARTVDTDGLVPKVKISGNIDGGGQAELWQKARNNVVAYLNAEFQNGWALLDSLSISNNPEAPDYLTGLFRYDADVLIVADPARGIGDTTTYVDQDVKGSTEYVSDCDSDGLFERLGEDSESYPQALDYRISGGTGKLNDEYLEWQEDFGTLDQSTTNYIWIEDPDSNGYGQVNTGTSGFPGNSLPLWEVDTGTSSVNDIRDQRVCLTGSRITDDELGDLNFQTSLSIDDDLAYERLLTLADTLAADDTNLLPALGLATFAAEALSVSDADLLFTRTFFPSDEVLKLSDLDPNTQLKPDLETRSATNIQDTQADLVGEITDLTGYSSVDAYFEYRESGNSTWNTTASQSLSSLTEYTQTVTGLNSTSEYEYRAVGDFGGSTTIIANTQNTFSTLTGTADPTLAQMMARREGTVRPPEIRSASGVSASEAQALARRVEGSWPH